MSSKSSVNTSSRRWNSLNSQVVLDCHLRLFQLSSYLNSWSRLSRKQFSHICGRACEIFHSAARKCLRWEKAERRCRWLENHRVLIIWNMKQPNSYSSRFGKKSWNVPFELTWSILVLSPRELIPEQMPDSEEKAEGSPKYQSREHFSREQFDSTVSYRIHKMILNQMKYMSLIYWIQLVSPRWRMTKWQQTGFEIKSF